jgi:hypothetical protein
MKSLGERVGREGEKAKTWKLETEKSEERRKGQLCVWEALQQLCVGSVTAV